jgi:peroxiredoxin
MRIQWLLILPMLLTIGCDKPAEKAAPAEKVVPARTGGGTGTGGKLQGDSGATAVKKFLPSPPPSIGDIARAIEGPDLEGVNFKLSDYRGKVLVLFFWGDWQPTCHTLYSHKQSLTKQLANKSFALIGVNGDGDLNRIRKIVKEKDIPWRSFQNQRPGQAPISKEWGLSEWPTLYVIDAEGKIRFRNVRGEELDRAVEGLLQEVGEEVTITHDDKPTVPADNPETADES